MSESSFIEGVDVSSFQSFDEEGYSEEDALVMAQGLLEDAIPCLKDIYPNLNSAQKTSAKFAVLEMAKYIRNDHENFDQSTSPFQSETLGAYSYSKMVRAVASQQATGIPAFDRAVNLLGGLCAVDGDGSAASTSEQVFKPGYGDFIRRRELGEQVHLRPYGYNTYWGIR